MIDLIQEIYGTIKRNKLRTFLTGFAVAWHMGREDLGVTWEKTDRVDALLAALK